MTLLQTKLPCSTNYFRYKVNYENYMLGYDKMKEKDTPGTVRTIASPKGSTKFSPIEQFKKQHNLVVNPSSQKTLLKYAPRKVKEEKKKKENQNDDSSDADNDDFS